MPFQCRFNKPTDVTSRDEYCQYVYAMQLWRLQDGLGLPFETASLYLSCAWDRSLWKILEYRADVSDPVRWDRTVQDLWDSYHSENLGQVIREWVLDNCRRFQGTGEVQDILVKRKLDGEPDRKSRKSKVRSHPWRSGEPLTEDEFREVRYATRIWLLQERVPLSFAEARIYLRREKPETPEDIARRFGLSAEDILRSDPEIIGKVAKAEAERDIFFGHGPICPEDSLN